MAIWTPADIDTALWLDASDSDTISLNGSGGVLSWADKSGYNRHAVHAGTSNATILADNLNGHNVVRLPGNNCGLNWPWFTKKTVFFVWRWRTPTAAYEHPFSGSGDFHGHDSSTINGTVYGGLGSQLGRTAAHRVDGVSIGTGVTLTRSSVPRIVSMEFATSPTGNWTGLGYADVSFPARSPSLDFCEVVAFPDVVDLDTHHKIEGYLAHKWGIATNLESIHPYKNIPPYSNVIGNTAKTILGAQADFVIIFNWYSGDKFKIITPNINGEWNTVIVPGVYGITYIADGYQPITHGPYTVTSD